MPVRRRLDLLEVALVAALVFVAGVLTTRAWLTASTERDALIARYGTPRWSRWVEEIIVRDALQDRRGGVFVDVGSADARHHSNTYFLESKRGWSGVAIDALAEYAPGYQTHRPRTRFFTFFVSDRSDERATVFVDAGDSELSSGTREFLRQRGRNDVVARDVPTITLTDLLERLGIEHFDFLSMDIELAEPKALTGFDIQRFQPDLVCIEMHSETRQWITDYFTRQGYALQVRYLFIDRNNLWFAPAAADGGGA
jgi:FkbM family methyltransferase